MPKLEQCVQQRVFNIFELSEQILLYAAEFSPRTVLTAQRVSKDWQAVVQNPTLIQQALWFKPCPSRLHALKQRIRAGNFNPNDPVSFNPVIWPVPPLSNTITTFSRKVEEGSHGHESWRKMLVAVLDIPTTKIEVYCNGSRISSIPCDGDTSMGKFFERAQRQRDSRGKCAWGMEDAEDDEI
ncbi:Putative F-box-like domain superfamily protein [Septoria linicola]|uniref:F-box-like domain superfamily protein n=1 Tax=Septoria linicola TaxID=215465 RepID=A0A9Q9B3W2_9PEZI|nr:putative F-box-like domain superfamily protein [Septoria linicola]USW56922.1 Putative F-box-like domain superfamily protein [Septoria linicola]